MQNEQLKLAEQIRMACLQAARHAYENAGISGLCEDGRWECATQAMEGLDLKAIIESTRAMPKDRV